MGIRGQPSALLLLLCRNKCHLVSADILNVKQCLVSFLQHLVKHGKVLTLLFLNHLLDWFAKTYHAKPKNILRGNLANVHLLGLAGSAQLDFLAMLSSRLQTCISTSARVEEQDHSEPYRTGAMPCRAAAGPPRSLVVSAVPQPCI